MKIEREANVEEIQIEVWVRQIQEQTNRISPSEICQTCLLLTSPLDTFSPHSAIVVEISKMKMQIDLKVQILEVLEVNYITCQLQRLLTLQIH